MSDFNTASVPGAQLCAFRDHGYQKFKDKCTYKSLGEGSLGDESNTTNDKTGSRWMQGTD